VRQSSVHRYPRGSHERRQVILSEIDVIALMGRCEAEQTLRDPPGHVEEHEVFDPAGRAPHRAGEKTEDLARRTRASLEHTKEILARERSHRALLHCGGRRW